MPAKRVSEPVQVYLEPRQRERLDRLTRQLGTSKSDVLRRGLEALERQLTDPAAHPALRLIGIAEEPPGRAADAARDHDRILTEDEARSWTSHDGG